MYSTAFRHILCICGFSLGGEVALGLKLGGGFSITNEDQKVASSTYLASPSAPGAPRQRDNNLVCD